MKHCLKFRFRGHFGGVYRGKWKGTEVALKKLKDPTHVAELKQEIQILK